MKSKPTIPSRTEPYAGHASDVDAFVGSLGFRLPIIAIDPGPEESALVVWQADAILSAIYQPNDLVLGRIREHRSAGRFRLVIEKVASFGMPVGAEVFETVFWSGRFAEAYGMDRVHRLTRMEVKMHLCHNSRAKDANIRQALIDRFGKPGTKSSPGRLYGVSGDLWAALAVAVTFWDQTHVQNPVDGVENARAVL